MRLTQKVTIVGAGNVGSTTAHCLVERQNADFVLLDVATGVAKGKALDMFQAGPVFGFDSRLVGTSDYRDTADSDVVVITAGFPRKPGMSRDDLLIANAKVVQEVVEQVVKYSPGCILIMVTNPLDAMAQLALKVSGFPRSRVIGMAGVLDTARFRRFLADELDVSVEDVTAFVLGGHGDEMVPLPRLSTVGGVPLTELLPPERIEAIVKRTRGGGGEIVDLLKTGSAYYAPAASIAAMVDSILLDKKRILPCSAYLDGEYGIHDLFVGVPAKLGRKGMQQIMQFRLSPEEDAALKKSAAAVRELVEKLKVA
ncbi:MAG: malate dehydrogenase [Chloroflexi bacterium]|nr:malate dehydrogenase [Chloroflexota bacterium]